MYMHACVRAHMCMPVWERGGGRFECAGLCGWPEVNVFLNHFSILFLGIGSSLKIGFSRHRSLQPEHWLCCHVIMDKKQDTSYLQVCALGFFVSLVKTRIITQSIPCSFVVEENTWQSA